MKTPKIAIVYDRINTFGGAERVLFAFKKLFPQALFYTSVYEPKTAVWAKNIHVRTSFLQNFSVFRTHHQYAGLFMPIAFESFDFSSFTHVISVTSEAGKGIITKPGTKHLCYLLTPTRYLWSHKDAYEHDYYAGMKKVLLPLHRGAIKYLQYWDTAAAYRPDLIIPISKTVQKRCLKFYKRTTEPVLYPPVDFSFFSTTRAFPLPWNIPLPYYLIVSRLVPYKRIDIAIQACIQLKRHLVIVGKGSEKQRLLRLAHDSAYIHFAGYLTDQALLGYYQHCTAFLFPGKEDFGITALESLAVGKPVLTNVESGNAEIILPGKTGIYLENMSIESIQKGIIELEHVQWNKSFIQKSVVQFDQQEWMKQWRNYL